MSTFARYGIYGYLLLVPWQTVYIVRERLVRGAKWEFTTIGIYATEALLFVVIALFFLHSIIRSVRRKSAGKDRIASIRWVPVVIGTIIAITGIVVAEDRWFAFFSTVRLAEMCALFVALSSYATPTFKRYFIIGLVPAALLGIAQFTVGVTWPTALLGLSLHTPDTLGVPVIAVNGVRHLRAFGSWQHPNVFGGYMALGVAASYLSLHAGNARGRKLLYGALCIFAAGLLFSFSRGALLASVVWLVSFFMSIHNHVNRAYLQSGRFISMILGMAIVMSLFYGVGRFSFSTLELQSATERVAQLSDAKTLFLAHPLLGVGIGNYTVALHALLPELPGYALQPVHVTPILVLVELGFFGCILLCMLIWRYRHLLLRYSGGIIFLAPLLMFDHYVWTLYSGLALAVCACVFLRQN